MQSGELRLGCQTDGVSLPPLPLATSEAFSSSFTSLPAF